MKNINPTKTTTWQDLKQHFEKIKSKHLSELFAEDSARKNNFSLNVNDIEFDYSKNRISKETLGLLLNLANEVNLKGAMDAYFSGEKINATENRAVLHTALRNKTAKKILVDGVNIIPEVKNTLNKIELFSNKVISGDWKGYSGKSITDVVNIGIGGSDLGPDMVVESLQYYKNQINTHFVS